MSLEPTTETVSADAAAPDCAHWWQIETPNGETSDGVCKHCGAARSFSNSSQTRMMARSVRAPSSSSTTSNNNGMSV